MAEAVRCTTWESRKFPRRVRVFTCVEIQLDSNGNGEGKMLNATKTTMSENARGAEVLIILLALLVLALPSPIAAQQSTCADCHFADPRAPGRDHLEDWDRSAHGRNRVGCEKCHGGNAATFESFLAHRGILGSANPSSPVHPRNLPTTCGACHAGPFVAFQKSTHFELLRKGDDRGPVCATCHGPVAGDRPSPKALEGHCAQCHGPRGIALRPERAAGARTLYEAINESREMLAIAKPLIGRVTNRTRRAELEGMYQQAEVPLTQAVQAGHEFVYDNLNERLATARQRIEALLGQLANPR